jgi:hypothetical protein
MNQRHRGYPHHPYLHLHHRSPILLFPLVSDLLSIYSFLFLSFSSLARFCCSCQRHPRWLSLRHPWYWSGLYFT